MASGIVEVSAISAESNNVVVVYDEKTTTSDKVIKALADKTGYTTVSASNEATAVGKTDKLLHERTKEAACSKKTKKNVLKTKCTKTE